MQSWTVWHDPAIFVGKIEIQECSRHFLVIFFTFNTKYKTGGIEKSSTLEVSQSSNTPLEQYLGIFFQKSKSPSCCPQSTEYRLGKIGSRIRITKKRNPPRICYNTVEGISGVSIGIPRFSLCALETTNK